MSKRTKAAPLAIVIALGIAVLALCFIFHALPDFVGLAREALFMPVFQRSAPEATVIARLRALGADWHYGGSFVDGETAQAFDLPIRYCRHNDCTRVVQAQFITEFGMCFEDSVVFSMRFDGQSHLISWQKLDAEDGC